MAKSSGKSAAKGEKLEAGTAKKSENDLPVVAAPKLATTEAVPEAEVVKAEPSKADEPAPAATAIPSSAPTAAISTTPLPRFVLLAATVALVAAIGAFFGSVAALGVVRFFPADAALARTADVTNVSQAMKLELAELAAIKSNLDSATRSSNSQFVKLADRLDRVEHAQTEPATQLAHIATAVDRLDKQSAASSASPSPSQAAAAPETTGSIKPPEQPAEQKLTDRILDDWIVHDVRGGRALVESRYHGLFDVSAGSFLPGLGRVDSVKRQDGHWIVVTPRGIITSAR